METIWYVVGVWSVLGLILALGPWTQRDDWEYAPMWQQRLIFFAYGPIAWGLVSLFLLIVGVSWVIRSIYRAWFVLRPDTQRSDRVTTRTYETPE